MQTLVYLGPHRIEVQDAAVPTPRPDEVVIRVEAAGACGSQLTNEPGDLIKAVLTPSS